MMRVHSWVVALVAAIFISSCQFGSKQNTKLFDKGDSQGVNNNKKLEEASGLIASINHPGYFWTHNDSGNPAQLFLLDNKAKTKRTYQLGSVVNRDWEDISMGPGPESNVNYIYIGDIGDNLRKFPLKFIYRFPEPTEEQGEVIQQFDTLIVKLEDGIFDSEALMIDPVSGNLYLISKQQKEGGVYEIKAPFTADTLVAKRLFDIHYGHINGGDISADGNEVLIKNYDDILYWKKSDHESIADLLKKEPTELYYDREPQGEAIGWARDGSGFFTLGENAKGERAKLYFYKRK